MPMVLMKIMLMNMTRDATLNMLLMMVSSGHATERGNTIPLRL